MTIRIADQDVRQRPHERRLLSAHSTPAVLVVALGALLGALHAARGVYASLSELRVDEAYYWTWSKEHVLSFLDHPPLIAWSIKFGTLLFGDSPFGIRFSGLLAMLAMQGLTADMVWRAVRDWRCVVVAVLLPEATLHYGLLMAKVAPDTALIPCELALLWALVRLSQSGDQRWWLAAGAFGGLMVLAKYTSLLLLPAVVIFVLVPDWRMRHLRSRCFWAAPLIVAVISAPVWTWNAEHGWISFAFQTGRPSQGLSTHFIGDFIGLQWALVGPLVAPIALVGTTMLAVRGWRRRDPVALLLSTATLVPLGFFLLRAVNLRIGDTWPLMAWPCGFAATAVNLAQWRRTQPVSWLARRAMPIALVAIAGGIALTLAANWYYLFGTSNLLGNNDPIGKEAGFADVVAAAELARSVTGATWFAATDYRIYAMLRWHRRDAVPVVQLNERARFLGFAVPAADALHGAALSIGSWPEPQLWPQLGATPEPLGDIDLVWRGVVYERFSIGRLPHITPELTPHAGDVLFVSVPH